MVEYQGLLATVVGDVLSIMHSSVRMCVRRRTRVAQPFSIAVIAQRGAKNDSTRLATELAIAVLKNSSVSFLNAVQIVSPGLPIISIFAENLRMPCSPEILYQLFV